MTTNFANFFEDADNRGVALRAFGRPVTLPPGKSTPQGQTSILGILEKETVYNEDSMTWDERYRLECGTEDVLGVVTEQEQIRVDGKLYNVSAVLPDVDGWTIMQVTPEEPS